MSSRGDNTVLRAPEAAARLGMDPKALRRKLRAGEMPGYQIGTTWFVYMSSVEDSARTRPATHPLARRPNHAADSAQVRLPPVDENRPVAGYETMANWSSWHPFLDACRVIPRLPGVYIARGIDGEIVYIGMAAERSGQGMRGRLAIYSSGKGATSGMGETALDLALADPMWMRARLLDAERGCSLRAKDLAKAALNKANLELRWATATDGPTAGALELAVIESFAGKPLWNRRR